MTYLNSFIEQQGKPSITLVIPAYDEEESLPVLLDHINRVMGEIRLPYNVLFVDDGSKDGTLTFMREAADRQDNVTVIEMRRNFGKSAALAAAFAVVESDIVITMDADLQDDPDELPRMLAKLDEGYDLVTGRKAHRHDPITKVIASRIANTTTRLITGVSVRDMNSGFKTYRTEVVKQINLYGDLHRYIPVLAHAKGFSVTEIPVTHHARKFGQSKYGFSRLFRGAMDFLTVTFLSSFQYRPLHLFGRIGLILSFIGFAIDLYLSILWFTGQAIGSRPLLMLGTLLIIVGVQFLSFGLVAELTVYHNFRRNDDPLKIVRRIYRGDKQ